MSEEPSSPFAGSRDALLTACAEMERRLHGLTDSHGRIADEIHEVRKLGKRLRGGLTVAGEAKACIRWIGLIGRMLGGVRDGVVREETWQSLKLPAAPEGSMEAAIGAMLAAEAKAAARKPPKEVVDWCQLAVSQVRGRIEAVGAEYFALRAEDGAERLKRRLCKRLKRALERVRNEDFHECRKAAKAWLGGVSVVAPELELPGREAAEKLCRSLGDENDLEVLAQWLEAHGFTSAASTTVWKRLRKCQEKVRRRSITLIRKELLPELK